MSLLLVCIALGSTLTGIATLIIVLRKILQDRKSGEPCIDERQERIDGKAARYSMLSTTIAIIAICVYYGFIIIIFDFPFDPLIAITLTVVVLVMLSSYSGFRLLFNRRSDFE